jgi:hypothetical protein
VNYVQEIEIICILYVILKIYSNKLNSIISGTYIVIKLTSLYGY